MSLFESAATSVINAVDRIIMRYSSLMKGRMVDYCQFDTPLNQHIMVTHGRSLVSFIDVKGVFTLQGDEEFIEAIQELELLFNGLLASSKHSLHWVFSRSPSQTKSDLARLFEPLKRAAKHQGFDEALVNKLFEDRLSVLNQYVVSESCLLALTTHPEALGSIERKAQQKDRASDKKAKAFNKNKLPFKFGEYAQTGVTSLSRLQIVHEASTQTLLNKLCGKSLGLCAELMDCHGAVRDIRLLTAPNETHEQWRPVLPGDPVPYREKSWVATERDNEFYPVIGSQIFKRSAETRGDLVKIGDYYEASTMIELSPQEPQRFDELFKVLPKHIDWRYSLNIIGGDKKFSGKIKSRRNMAQIFRVTNSGHNEPIISACNNLLAIRDKGELLGGVRIQLTVRGKTEAETTQHIHLCARLMQAWGNCDTTFERGDPLDAIISSLPGMDTRDTGTTLIQPIRESALLCPITRPVSPWQAFGINFYRTMEGKLFPVQSCSSEQQTWINLIYAPPGSGKSVLMNSQNLNLNMMPGLTRLPRINILDIGPSSLGLIQLLQELLPGDRKGEAVYKALKQNKASSINPFDTVLGMRFPHASKINFIKSFLLLLFTEDGQTSIRKGVGELVTMLILETYKTFSDEYSPKPYVPHIEIEVDQIIEANPDWFYQDQAINKKQRNPLTWWKVVDSLAEHGLWREASLAQRQAVPLLMDLTGILHTNQSIKDIFVKTKNEEETSHHLVKMIRSAINDYVILSHPTQFNVGEARVVSLDLADVTGAGSKYTLKKSGLMYMLGREVMLGNLYFNEDDVKALPEPYKSYHQRRINQELGDVKRVCFDEFHRTSKLEAVQLQVEQDMREARKYKVEITLASQRHKDFSEAMVELASNIYICNSASGKILDDICKTFDLNPSQRKALQYEVHGAGSEGATFMLKCKTKKGEFVQVLVNSLGLIELWALSSTAEDALIRKQLVKVMPYFLALSYLAKTFPSGSCKKYITDRAMESGQTTEIIIDEVVENIIKQHNRRMNSCD
jgi:intracellular multiplication protein IcmB